MKTNRHIICIVYDPLLKDLLGIKTAQAFDWLYSFLHLAEKPTGMIRDGRKWGLFTYKQLAEASNALPNAYAWQRALAKLEEVGLVISEMDIQNNGGKYYAIHFARVLEVIGEDDFNLGYGLDMLEQKNRQPLWLEKWEPVEEESKQGAKAGQSKQSAEGGLGKLLRGSQQNAEPPIYIDSDSKDSIKGIDSTPSNEGDTKPSNVVKEEPVKEAEIEKAKDVFMAISRIACYGLAVSAETRKLVAGAIAKIENTQTAKKESLVLDVEVVEDYSIWRMLIDWKGKNGFPMIGDFEKEFRYQFLGWYSSEENRKKLALVKEFFPEWRVRLFDGDYAAFREEVQDALKRGQGTPPTTRGGGSKSPITRQGRAAKPWSETS